MKPRYHVVTVYEGRCPTCGCLQTSQVNPQSVDDECIRCEHERISKALINKNIKIYDITGNELSGYIIKISSNHKIYTIDATNFKEGL